MPTASRSSRASRTAASASPATPCAHEADSAHDYFARLLQLVKSALNPDDAAVWTVDERGVFSRAAQLDGPARSSTRHASAARAHGKRLLDALTHSEPSLVKLDAEQDAESYAPARVEVLAPFHDGGRVGGILEVVVSATTTMSDAELTAAVAEFAAYAARHAASRRTACDGPPSRHAAFNRVVLELHRHDTVGDVALTAVNDGRLLLGFDRLSLAVRRGNRAQLLAVSGQAELAGRSNSLNALRDLATAVLPTSQPLAYGAAGDELPPPLQQTFADYQRASGVSSIHVIPVPSSADRDAERPDGPSRALCGVLLGEQFQDGPRTDAGLDDDFAEHVALALTKAQELEHARTPLARLWRRLFASSELRQGRTTAVLCALAAAALIALGVMPVRRRVEAVGRLAPVTRRELFAPVDCRVSEVLVTTNQAVAAGDIVVRLEAPELSRELLTARNLAKQQDKLLATLEEQTAEAHAQGRSQDAIRLNGAIAQARIEATTIQSRIASLQAQVDDLEVRAPISGTVATFDPRRALLHRPLERGEPMLEIIHGEGRWELNLDLPAKRVGEVLHRQQAADRPTTVQFALATEPETTYTGALRTVSNRIVANADATSVAPVVVDIAVDEIAHPVAGAEVIAKIDCGRQPLARVLFGDVLDAVRRVLW